MCLHQITWTKGISLFLRAGKTVLRLGTVRWPVTQSSAVILSWRVTPQQAVPTGTQVPVPTGNP